MQIASPRIMKHPGYTAPCFRDLSQILRCLQQISVTCRIQVSFLSFVLCGELTAEVLLKQHNSKLQRLILCCKKKNPPFFPQKSLGYIRYAKLEAQPSAGNFTTRLLQQGLPSLLRLTLENSPQFKIKAPYLDYVLRTEKLTNVGFSKVKKKLVFSAVKSKSIESSSMCICKINVLPMCYMLSGVKYVLQCAHYCIKA